MTKVITYGTYDLLHQGHINLLRRAKELGDYLIVGVTSDSFDRGRGKLNVRNNVLERVEAVKATGYADEVIIEDYLGQKIDDIQKYDVDIFAIGSDWEGKFDYLNEFCKVVYLPRTQGVSSTMLRAESQDIFKVGVVGSGRIAKRFVPETKVVNGIEVTSVFDPNKQNAEAYATQFELKAYSENYQQFLSEVDAVYVASPHLTHYQYVKEALEAGKHVLCEIPFTLSGAQAKELYDYAEAHNLVLLEASKTAYCPAFCHITTLVKSGVIGDVVDHVNFKKMPAANVAYGRIVDGGNKWQYEVTPTPGAANNSVGATKVLPEPEFSIKGHVMSGPESLTVSFDPTSVPTDTRLYVTLDGSEPTTSSPSYDQSVTMNISESTVVRAKLISGQALPRLTTTHSYIFHPRATTLPIVSIVSDADYFYSKEKGILSSDTATGYTHPNWHYEWRRPINSEYFASAGTEAVFNQVGETAVGGSTTKSYAQKSLKFYANKRFETKRFKGSFWENKTNVTEVKSFTLRNGGNNCYTSRILDAYVQRIFGTHMPDLDYQEYTPTIMYINGEYKGIFGMRERSDEDHVESNHGVEDALIGDAWSYSTTDTTSPFGQFKAAYTNPSTTYSEMCNLLDVENFNQVLIAECFGVNVDYPHNNVSMWNLPDGSGKWKWILKDMDFLKNQRLAFNMFDFMFLTAEEGTDAYTWSHSTDQRYQAHLLYQKMISFPEYQKKFVDGFSVCMGDFLKTTVSIPMLESMAAEIDAEVAPTFAAYDNMAQYSDFTKGIANLKTFFRQRPAIVYSQLSEYFNLGHVVSFKTINNGQEVSINGIQLTEGDFDGSWYMNHELTLKSEADNYRWNMELVMADGSVLQHNFSGNEITVTLYDYLRNEHDEIVSASFSLDDKEEYTLDMVGRKYATICVPFDFDVPSGLILYRLDSYDPETGAQNRTRVYHAEANKPYLTRCANDVVFSLSGYKVAANPMSEDYLKLGCLTGTYTDISANPNDIVIGTSQGVYYKVQSFNHMTVAANNAYIKSDNIVGEYTISLNNSKYNTVCVPFAFTAPVGTKFYTVVAFNPEGKKMTVARAYNPEANKPYLVKGTPNTDYTIKGFIEDNNESGQTDLTNGKLVGTYEDIYAPSSSYVIPYPGSQKADWYLVKADNTVLVEAKHAYLSLSAPSLARTRSSNGETTDIEIIDFSGEVEEIDVIFNVNGMQVPNIQKGLNVVRMKDGTTRKIIVQ